MKKIICIGIISLFLFTGLTNFSCIGKSVNQAVKSKDNLENVKNDFTNADSNYFLKYCDDINNEPIERTFKSTYSSKLTSQNTGFIFGYCWEKIGSTVKRRPDMHIILIDSKDNEYTVLSYLDNDSYAWYEHTFIYEGEVKIFTGDKNNGDMIKNRGYKLIQVVDYMLYENIEDARPINTPNNEYSVYYDGTRQIDLLVEKVQCEPDIPTITGPTSGKIGTEYIYTASSTDPNGDNIQYKFKFGNNEETEWLDPNSGNDRTYSYTFHKEGDFVIKAKAKDSHGAESDWSQIEVSMPRIKPSASSIFINNILLRFLENHQILQLIIKNLLIR